MPKAVKDETTCFRNRPRVQWIAEQNIDEARSDYHLPRKVLDEREKAWNRFFDKYVNEKPDEKELNIDTLEEITNHDGNVDEEDEDDVDDDDDDDDDEDDDEDDNDVAEHHKEYDSKHRVPMRMLPALVQYWIDTGNSPYRLVDEEDHSESGSSLSEEEHSPLGKSTVRKENCDKKKLVENSPCSSVDTAAYILSNANVTKKAEMMALVEDSRRREEIIAGKAACIEKSLIRECRVNMGDKNISLPFVEPNECFVKDSPTLRVSNSNDSSNVSPKNQSSVKLSDVLPALAHLDVTQGEAEPTDKTPVTRSMLSKNHTLSQNNEQTSKHSSENIFENSTKKFINRRKLYTGRNSPVDLMVATTQMQTTTTTTTTTTAISTTMGLTRTPTTTTTMGIAGKFNQERRSHPALEPPSIEAKKGKSIGLAFRARARRKRKRGSLRDGSVSMEVCNSRADAVGQEKSSSSIDAEDNNAKDKMRYTDFFESLGLTPRQTIMGGQGLVERASKREEESRAMGGEDSIGSPENAAIVAKQLGDKVVRVQLVRLSDKYLSRYAQRESQNLPSIKSSGHCSSRCSVGKGESLSKSPNIELLNIAALDSDSSTIFICSCTNATEDRDYSSNCSISTRNSSAIEKSSGENIESTSAERSNDSCEGVKRKVESSQHGKCSGETGKYEEPIIKRNLVVRVEKLSLANLSRITKRRDNLRKLANWGSNGSLKKSDDEVETAARITIESRVFGDSSKVPISTKSNEKRLIRSANDSIAMLSLSSGEKDDDSFKFSREIRSENGKSCDDRTSRVLEKYGRLGAKRPIRKRLGRCSGRGTALGLTAISLEKDAGDTSESNNNRGSKRWTRNISINERTESGEGCDEGCGASTGRNGHRFDVNNRDSIGGGRKQIVTRGKSIVEMDASVCRKEEERQRASTGNGEESEYPRILGKETNAKKHRASLSKNVVHSLKREEDPRRLKSSRDLPRFKTMLDSDSESVRTTWLCSPTKKFTERQSKIGSRAENDQVGKKLSSETRVVDPLDIGKMKISTKANDRISTRDKPPLSNINSTRRQNSLKQSISSRISVGRESQRGRSDMTKKLRKRKVVEKCIESESENGVESTISFNKSTSSCDKSTCRTSRGGSKRLADKNWSVDDGDDKNPLKKRQLRTNNIFSNVLHENIEDARLKYGKRGDFRVGRSQVMLENLNLGTTRRRIDRVKPGPSTMRFRTRLDPDSEDGDGDGDYDVS